MRRYFKGKEDAAGFVASIIQTSEESFVLTITISQVKSGVCYVSIVTEELSGDTQTETSSSKPEST